MKFKIDNLELEVDAPISIYHAAQKLGIEIPIMCYKPGLQHFTSCMICMVKDKTSGRMLPACSAQVADGMDIETINDEIRGFRKSTLELLLSDHVGDCEAPCQRLCTVHLEVPKMIRDIMAGRMDAAIASVREEMAIPSILERYCNASCEKGCRRAKHDEGLSIRELTRYVADWDLRREQPFIPTGKPPTGKRVAVIGAGATGLSAAYFLALAGHDCVLFEKSGRIGGRVHSEFRKELIEDWVFEGEMRVLRELGVDFQFNHAITTAEELAMLRKGFDAIVLAPGAVGKNEIEALGISVGATGIKVNATTNMTELKGVFAGGSVIKAKQPLAKSVLSGKTIAALITQYLTGKPLVGLPDMYNHNMGRLLDGELEAFVSGASSIARLKPERLEFIGFTEEEAKTEGTRCMHCDCRKNHDCKLRIYSDEYKAEQAAFKGEERAKHVHIDQNAGALYEPEKCIKCGLCVRISDAHRERYGFTFVGRGFDVRAGIALNKTLKEGLERVADEVVAACPTGALAKD
jgi:NADPH-dependent glutamate synthase beta subunit-like oxidoreductase/ferredoxin